MRYLSLLIVFLFISSCSTGGINEKRELKNYFQTKSYDLGLKFLEESKFYKNENERLLYLMEKGTFLFSKGDFQNASFIFEEAINKVKENYTISVSSKIEKSVKNDNYDRFYGEIYEHSFLYFYASLSYLSLYYQTSDRNFLFKARASILGWDSFLKSVREERLGKSVYKNDLTLKIYGAKIHELVGTREDINIALNLYKDAKEILFKNYNSYQSFNLKNEKFKKNFEKLSSMKIAEVKKDYVDETLNAQNLNKFIENQIERLNKKKESTLVHVSFLFQNQMIAEKMADKVDFSLDGLSNEPLMRYFVANVLGLIPHADYASYGDVHMGMASADLTMKMFKFYYELPKVLKTNYDSDFKLEIIDSSSKLIATEKLNLINPMDNIAGEAIDESSDVIKARTTARVAGKHLAAITTAFATYKAMGGGTKNENTFARTAAIFQYAASTRLIAESEAADLRQWTSLPNSILMADLDLKAGDYKLVVKENDLLIFEQNFKIENNDQNKIFYGRK